MSDQQYWNRTWEKGLGAANGFAKRAVALMKPRSAILDLGCGTGKDSLYFAKRGHRVTALDFSVNAMTWLQSKAATEKLGIRAVCRDISKKLPFRDRAFDAVYAHLSLHYFDDATTARIFREVHRVLKRNGLFFVKCKSIDDAHFGKGKNIAKDMFIGSHTRRFFRKEFMQELLQPFTAMQLRKSSLTYRGQKSSCIEAIARK